MTPAQTARLLAKAALIDNRMVDEMTIAAWAETLASVDARDAMEALTMHRQRSTDYLQPAHIVALAKEAKRNREHDENRERAQRALPPGKPTPVPESFRRFRANLGKGPYSPSAAAKAHTGSSSNADAARPSEAAQEAAERQGTETA